MESVPIGTRTVLGRRARPRLAPDLNCTQQTRPCHGDRRTLHRTRDSPGARPGSPIWPINAHVRGARYRNTSPTRPRPPATNLVNGRRPATAGVYWGPPGPHPEPNSNTSTAARFRAHRNGPTESSHKGSGDKTPVATTRLGSSFVARRQPHPAGTLKRTRGYGVGFFSGPFLRLRHVPKPLKGLGITFIVTALMAIGFMSFSGINI